MARNMAHGRMALHEVITGKGEGSKATGWVGVMRFTSLTIYHIYRVLIGIILYIEDPISHVYIFQSQF